MHNCMSGTAQQELGSVRLFEMYSWVGPATIHCNMEIVPLELRMSWEQRQADCHFICHSYASDPLAHNFSCNLVTVRWLRKTKPKLSLWMGQLGMLVPAPNGQQLQQSHIQWLWKTVVRKNPCNRDFELAIEISIEIWVMHLVIYIG